MGLILAGGGARRLGGGDKPLRLLAGRPLLAHVAERLAPQCAALVLSANGDPSRFAPWDGPVVADHAADRDSGPLAGLLAGLDAIAQDDPDCDTVLSLPGDTPFVPGDLAARLAAARPHGQHGIAVASSGGRQHPLAALWPVEFRHDLRRLLRLEGVRRVRDVLRDCPVATVDWPVERFDPFFNINRPEDLAVAEAWLAGA